MVEMLKTVVELDIFFVGSFLLMGYSIVVIASIPESHIMIMLSLGRTFECGIEL